MYSRFLKRVLDFLFAFTALILLAPIFLTVTIALWFANNGKPFFYQERPGLKGEVFKIIKFKSMNDRVDDAGKLLPDEERLTKAGSFVRKTSLDEIPQLINVLKGDMSVVGPRPLRTYYLPLYSVTQNRRHEVRPGITGWAQVNGRNAISWTKKFEYDVWYVDNVNFLLDVKILFMTFLKVFMAKDINAEGHATTERFNGKN